jgi:hypothetical protein
VVKRLFQGDEHMIGPYTREKIENWASDCCMSDQMRPFSPGMREVGGTVLVTFLAGACEGREIEPEDVEEEDVRASLLGPVARLALPEGVRAETPALCGAF